MPLVFAAGDATRGDKERKMRGRRKGTRWFVHIVHDRNDEDSAQGEKFSETFQYCEPPTLGSVLSARAIEFRPEKPEKFVIVDRLRTEDEGVESFATLNEAEQFARYPLKETGVA